MFDDPPFSDYAKYAASMKLEVLIESEFNAISEQSWVDFLLQTYKCLVLPKTLKSKTELKMSSNIYSDSELILLDWLNEQYDQNRDRIWPCGRAAPRWVVNFDFDLMDGLVLGAVFSAYAPYITEHLHKMHPDPTSSEECLHNGLVFQVQFTSSICLLLAYFWVAESDPQSCALCLVLIVA